MLHIAKRLATLFALFLALTPALVFGQASFEAQVRGVVHDATGSVIIGAKVTITDVATNISSSATTDERGYYIFNGLHPGDVQSQGRDGGLSGGGNARTWFLPSASGRTSTSRSTSPGWSNR